jgi:basic membrane lipoprotein Med (substrate-binding protein (PBP1-ABC) superfamily)
MKKFRNIFATAILTGLVLGISACSSTPPPEPEHKAKTTACLIRSTVLVPGTPERQLAADLVEAKIVYGLAVREIKIDDATAQVSSRLLQALQAGCVLMVSANTNYLLPMADFSKAHPKMLALFVGGEIDIMNQPSNLRWIADDIQAAARLAGFFAAGKSESARVHLFAQGTYSQSASIQSAFVEGVKDFEESSNSAIETVLIKPGTAKSLNATLATLNSQDVVAIFGGRSIWESLPVEQTDGPYLIGADLQLGESILAFESRVQVSVERNTSKYLLDAVSSLLDRKVDSDPLYRKPGALKFNTVELRIAQPDSLPGSLLGALNAYKQDLISSPSR